MTELADFIASAPLADTHEHLWSESTYLERGPDLLGEFFGHYAGHDLVAAGATPAAVERAIDSTDPDIEARWAGIAEAWSYIQHTGYGEVVRHLARATYGIETLSAEAIRAAQERQTARRQPGERLRILRDEANLAYVQVDNFSWDCGRDDSGPDFFYYDLSMAAFVMGMIDRQAIYDHTGFDVTGLASLRNALERLFERYGPAAIAVKTQHAYNRTLLWHERDDSDAARALRAVLADQATEADRLCLGDWCLARAAEYAAEHRLPIKIHTGYYAGTAYSYHNDRPMPVERIKPGNLCDLLARYGQTRFVLMHSAYPYSEELIAIAKYYPNVYIDMCWAWSINPYAIADFARRTLHAVPVNRVFAFGGDTFWPGHAAAYAAQARKWLTRALEAEVTAGDLTEREAIAVAERWTGANQAACFDFEGTRNAIAAL
jgi:predicted TIM-barrel fold metal-dependent hydrolase